MTLKQWDANPELQRELADLFKHPTIVAAIEVVKLKGYAPITPPTGVDIVQYGAMMGFKRDGYFEALINLSALAQPPTTKPPGVKAWEEPPQKPVAPVS